MPRTERAEYALSMMDTRPIALLLVIVGGVGIVVSALADPLGIGEGEVFGWLQITGVVIGAVLTLLGVAFAADWVSFPGRSRQVEQVGTGGDGQNTTIVTESTPRKDPPPK